MVKYCPKCGEKTNNSKFCPECGYNLEKTNNTRENTQNKSSKKNIIIIGLIAIIIILILIFGIFSISTSNATHEIQFINQGFAFNVSNDYETNNTYSVDTVSMDVLFQTGNRDFHVRMAGSKYLDELSSFESNSNTWKKLDDLNTLDGNVAHIFESRSGGGYACFIENPFFDENLDGFDVNTYKYVYIGTSDYNDAVTIIESFYWYDNAINASLTSNTQSKTNTHINTTNTTNNTLDDNPVNPDIPEDDPEWIYYNNYILKYFQQVKIN